MIEKGLHITIKKTRSCSSCDREIPKHFEGCPACDVGAITESKEYEKVENYLQLYQGFVFDFENPSESAIDIVTIAHSLGNLCRFNGQCDKFYSVAEHCYNMSFVVPEELMLIALLHDAHEAFVSDIPSPLKRYLKSEFFILEKTIIKIMHEYFGMWDQYTAKGVKETIKYWDMRMLATEVEQLMGGQQVKWHSLEGIKPIPDVRIHAVPNPDDCKWMFMDRFRTLARLEIVERGNKALLPILQTEE